jgi:hypothetical protein
MSSALTTILLPVMGTILMGSTPPATTSSTEPKATRLAACAMARSPLAQKRSMVTTRARSGDKTSNASRRSSPPPPRPRPPRRRSPRLATTSLPPARAAAFIAVLHDVALCNSPGHGPCGPSCRHATRPERLRHARPMRSQRPSAAQAVATHVALLHGSRVVPSQAGLKHGGPAPHPWRPRRGERRGGGTQALRPTRAQRGARWRDARSGRGAWRREVVARGNGPTTSGGPPPRGGAESQASGEA